jgi:hypothetical protein
MASRKTRLQRPLPLLVLSSAVSVQPIRRPGAPSLAAGSRPQRRRLARGAGASDRPLPRARNRAVLPRRPGPLTARPESRRCSILASAIRREAARSRVRCGQCRVAPGRIVPARRLHRHQPDPTGRAGGQVLQRSEQGGVVGQGGQAGAVFRANAVRLQLSALAYNLANFLRTLVLPEEVAQWLLTSLREKLIKIGADRAPRPLCHVPAGGGGGNHGRCLRKSCGTSAECGQGRRRSRHDERER